MSEPIDNEHPTCFSIFPPDFLEGVAESEVLDDQEKDSAAQTLRYMQGQHESLGELVDKRNRGGTPQLPPGMTTGDGEVQVYITAISDQTPFQIEQIPVRRYDGEALMTAGFALNPIAHETYENIDTIKRFYKEVLGLESFDGYNHDIRVTVQYLVNHIGAFWNIGHEEAIIGGGDDKIASSLHALDILAHEIDHGNSQYHTALGVGGQPGALREHKSDVTAVTLMQWHLDQEATPEAHWTIGASVILDWVDVHGHRLDEIEAGTVSCSDPTPVDYALRSFKDQKAYQDHPLMAADKNEDTQVKHMRSYVVLPVTANHDFGGIHKYSGIPNHAFYLASVAIGGNVWETIYPVWYQSFTEAREDTGFKDFARLTIKNARELARQEDSPLLTEDIQKIEQAWRDVGVL